MWARVKATMGYRAARVVVKRNRDIVAGAQMLMRRLGPVCAVGYVPKGPAALPGEATAVDLALQELQRIARREKVRLLLLQPAGRDDAMTERLSQFGFRASPFELSPTATCVLDLTCDLDDLYAGMTSGKRYNLRLAKRNGIVIREGSGNDLKTFYRLLAATGQRQRFSVYPEEYFQHMWRTFSERGCVRLSLAEFRGEAVSGQIAIAFNDTVINKMAAWSGAWGKYCPNELLHWTTIEWAKAAGFHWYDWEGIPPDAAQARLRNEPLPGRYTNSVVSFKLGFGGQPLLLPGTYDYAPNLSLRWAYRMAASKLVRSPWLRDAAYRLRTRAARN
jgi:lipid II:glycine glycyltransferase (peptidoglycan interpeptide bridge formation enzyme)